MGLLFARLSETSASKRRDGIEPEQPRRAAWDTYAGLPHINPLPGAGRVSRKNERRGSMRGQPDLDRCRLLWLPADTTGWLQEDCRPRSPVPGLAGTGPGPSGNLPPRPEERR